MTLTVWLFVHILDPQTHLVRYAGVYANRCRRDYRREGGTVVVVSPALPVGGSPPRVGPPGGGGEVHVLRGTGRRHELPREIFLAYATDEA